MGSASGAALAAALLAAAVLRAGAMSARSLIRILEQRPNLNNVAHARGRKMNTPPKSQLLGNNIAAGKNCGRCRPQGASSSPLTASFLALERLPQFNERVGHANGPGERWLRKKEPRILAYLGPEMLNSDTEGLPRCGKDTMTSESWPNYCPNAMCACEDTMTSESWPCPSKPNKSMRKRFQHIEATNPPG